MRPGPKGNSPQEQAAKNVNPPGRRATTVVSMFTDDVPDPGVIPPAIWLSGDAKAIWKAKVGRYRRRGQKIDGFQDTLAQYCQLEAQVIKQWRKSETPTASMLQCYRLFAAEFFDTPASQKLRMSAIKRGNRFSARGARNGLDVDQ